MPIARSQAVTGSAQLVGKTIYGWNFSENAGTPAAARVLLRDGSSSGAIVGDIRLAASESAGAEYFHPIQLTAGHLYVEVNSGTVRGAVYLG